MPVAVDEYLLEIAEFVSKDMGDILMENLVVSFLSIFPHTFS